MPKKNYKFKKSKGKKFGNRPMTKSHRVITEPKRLMISTPNQIIPKYVDVCYKSRTQIKVTGATGSTADGQIIIKANSTYRPFFSALGGTGDMAFVSSFSALDAPIGASIYANLYNEVRVYNSKITVTTSGVQGSGSQGIGLVIYPSYGSVNCSTYEQAVRAMYSKEKKFIMTYAPKSLSTHCSTAKLEGVSPNVIMSEDDYVCAFNSSTDPTNPTFWNIRWQTTDGANTSAAANPIIFQIELLQWARLENPRLTNF